MKYLKTFEFFDFFNKDSVTSKKNVELLVNSTKSFLDELELFAKLKKPKGKDFNFSVNNMTVKMKDNPLDGKSLYYIMLKLNTIDFLKTNDNKILLKIFIKDNIYPIKISEIEKNIADFLVYVCEKANNFQKITSEEFKNGVNFYKINTIEEIKNFIKYLTKSEFEFFLESEKYNL